VQLLEIAKYGRRLTQGQRYGAGRNAVIYDMAYWYLEQKVGRFLHAAGCNVAMQRHESVQATDDGEPLMAPGP